MMRSPNQRRLDGVSPYQEFSGLVPLRGERMRGNGAAGDSMASANTRQVRRQFSRQSQTERRADDFWEKGFMGESVCSRRSASTT